MKKEEIKKYSKLWFKELITGRRFLFWFREVLDNPSSFVISLFFLVVAVLLNVLSGTYVSKVGEAVSTDIILDHFGPYNLQFLFSNGYLFLMFVLFLFPLFFRIKELHKVVRQWSLLVMVRSFFVSLTHLKTPLSAVPPKFPIFFEPFVFTNDLFFSGHVATTFLGFLLFKDSKIKWFFLIGSFVMSVVVLLTHQHYSIDVFAAYFIAYGTYKFGNWFFSKIK